MPAKTIDILLRARDQTRATFARVDTAFGRMTRSISSLQGLLIGGGVGVVPALGRGHGGAVPLVADVGSLPGDAMKSNQDTI